MKLTKKIVSLAAVLALSCTFAVSAAEVAIDGKIVEASGSYSVNLTTTGVAETDQYTVLVYRVGDNGIMDTVATATLPAPSNTNITYINQDAFSTIKADDAYTIAFALGAIDDDGVYKVMVGGTGITTAAVGYFEVGTAAPAYKLGDANADGIVNISDATAIVEAILAGSPLTYGGADVNEDGTIGNISDATAIVEYILAGKVVDGSIVK